MKAEFPTDVIRIWGLKGMTLNVALFVVNGFSNEKSEVSYIEISTTGLLGIVGVNLK